MKNIHVLPTDKKSKLVKRRITGEIKISSLNNPQLWDNVNIYITNEVEIKKDDYVVAYGVVIKVMMSDNDRLFFVNGTKAKREDCKKIILTTDQDLIKEGVQAIDDEFLEWFVKNPSCERVEIDHERVLWENGRITHYTYRVIIPKQETLEEDLHQLFKNNFDCYADVDSDNVIMAMTEDCFIETFKEWQQQQNKNLYSEEDLEQAFVQGASTDLFNTWNLSNEEIAKEKFKEWFNQNKKK